MKQTRVFQWKEIVDLWCRAHKTQVVIMVEGGLVQGVFITEGANISVDVLDFDNLKEGPIKQYEAARAKIKRVQKTMREVY